MRNRTVMAVVLAAGLSGAPVAVAPPSTAPRIASPMRVLDRAGEAFGIPLFGRSELRLLISKRLKLVLDYRPTAYC